MTDPRSSRTEGYHLFFEPTGEAATLLSDTIQSLSAEYGGPIFAPHLTLLTTIPEANEEELIEKSRALASNFVPFTLTLSGFAAEETYFRTLYMTVQNADEVADYHMQARAVFGGDDAGPYVPHVSLLYGMYEVKRKQQSIARLEQMLPVSFSLSSLTLWHTPGDTTTWRKVGEYPFGK